MQRCVEAVPLEKQIYLHSASDSEYTAISFRKYDGRYCTVLINVCYIFLNTKSTQSVLKGLKISNSLYHRQLFLSFFFHFIPTFTFRTVYSPQVISKQTHKTTK
jgi:hypothetical protein